MTTGREFHVSTDGDDDADGSRSAPLETISAAAERARAGDAVVVHEGTYRERVDPPRGGTAQGRIVYRAADGARPEIKGSEVVEGWEQVRDGVWRVSLPEFDGYNPYDDRIRGDWFDDTGRDHHTGDVYLNGESLIEAASREAVLSGEEPRSWHAAVDGETTIWARFGADPADETVEINVRPAVFYPSEPGIDYLTVRGFALRHAATQWAPPTTEQIGLLGTHWGHGWIIEDNVVSHSRCTGITLGKYGDSVDDTGASAERYNGTIREALDDGWERGSVGGHVVRGNEVHHCEQAGIAGSMGAAFSEITRNHVHDINVEGRFGGAELAGMKFHGPIDATIRNNRIHDAHRGIWLDWMTQGTRVAGNLCYRNGAEDFFVEVSHGPYLVENNLFLSASALRIWSQGGAYAHNLVAGGLEHRAAERETPFHGAHSTAIAGLSDVAGGDDRFYNNLFVGIDLAPYDDAELAVPMAGNVYLGGAVPSIHEDDPLVFPDAAPEIALAESGERVTLSLAVSIDLADGRPLVTTDLLGRAALPDVPFENPDGSPIRVDADYFGDERDADDPAPGPFARLDPGRNEFDVWP